MIVAHRVTVQEHVRCTEEVTVGIYPLLSIVSCAFLLACHPVSPSTIPGLPLIMSAISPVEHVALSTRGQDKMGSERLDYLESGQALAMKQTRTMEAPPLVAMLTPEERAVKERAMVRKVDFRLLPPVIIVRPPHHF